MKYLESNNSNEVQSDFEVKLAYITPLTISYQIVITMII